MKDWNTFFVFAGLCFLLTNAAQVTVHDASELVALFQSGNVPDDIALADDLDFSDTNLINPLGSNNGTCQGYSGVFNGKGHSIKGLEMNATKYAGLFCSLKDATVQNLVFDPSCSFNGTEGAGALSVNLTGSVLIQNVTNKAAVSGNVKAGGLIGYAEGIEEELSISFDECVNEGNVTKAGTGRVFVGGLVGLIYRNKNLTIAVSKCINNGHAIEGYDAGGFFGSVQNNDNVVMTLSHATNNGTLFGAFSGGFCAHVLENTNVVLAFSSCTNNGDASDGVSGGFVASITSNPSVSVTFVKSTNNGAVSAVNSGGFVGLMTANKQVSVTIMSSANNGDVFGNGRYATMNIGGFIGRISKNSNITLALSSSANNGRVTWTSSLIGGFVGEIESNTKMAMTISNSTNNGDATGNDFYTGGFVGHIKLDREAQTFALDIINSANKGEISCTRGVACGLFYVAPACKGEVTTTVLNSINRGNVSAANAYGITNIVTTAKNVVSMGDVNGTTGSAYTFWNASTDVRLFFGMNGTCANCSADTILFAHNSSTGFYEVVRNGEHVEDILNAKSLDQNYGMLWTSDLELFDAPPTPPTPTPSPSPAPYPSPSSKSGATHCALSLLAVFFMGALFMMAL